VCVTLLAYVLGPNALNAQSSREIAAVLPLGAALAGRMLAGRVRRVRLVPALAAVLAVYLGGLAYYATRPAVPADSQTLANWLVSHRLHDGLTTNYWVGNSTTVDSGGRAAVRTLQVDATGLGPNLWEIDLHWYSPSTHTANFAVLPTSGTAPWRQTPGADTLVHSFGKPFRVYQLAGFLVLVWHENLLTKLVRQ
jgi:hypothetical protein